MDSIRHINIETKIYLIRNQRIMIDRDLAELYQVKTGNLNRQVKRNALLFEGFVFRLTNEEIESLRCQNGTANISTKSRVNPLAFTEHGALLLSSVLKSTVAHSINRYIVNAFLELRRVSPEIEEIKTRLEKLEKISDDKFREVGAFIKAFMSDKLTQIVRKE